MARKWMALVLAVLLMVTAAACTSGDKTYQDGVYSAEFMDYDSYGYKDFLRITVRDGQITEVLFDGLNADGQLKTDDEKYASNMESVQQTYPEKYTGDLMNQLLEKQNIDKVDAIAGASYSSECFKALFAALDEAMQAGRTDPIYVENVPVK